MAEIVEFNLSKEDYLALGDRSLSEGSAERSVTYLKKALALDGGFTEASIRLAGIYAELGAHQISNTVLYKALFRKTDPDSEDRIFYQLAANFLELGDAEVAGYYMRVFGEDVELGSPDEGERTESGFSVVYPHGEDYYEMLIDKAYRAVRERRFDDALELADQVDPRSKAIDAANHVKLVCYMMKSDLDRVIDEAKSMLKTNDSLAVRSTLATAYMMEEKLPEAYAVVDEILATEYTRLEDILLLLPLLVNLQMHAYVVKYTKRVLDSLNLQPNTMIWLSQGLYNIGQKEEAIKVMNRVNNIYGEYSPAEYYLDYYKTSPPLVEYNMNLPYTEKMNRYKRLDDFVAAGKAEFEMALKEPDGELQRLVRWAFLDGNDKVELMLMNRLDFIQTDWVRNLYREVLVLPELSFEVMSRVLASLLNGGYTLEFSVVTQDRFKDVSLCLPDGYYHLPHVLKDAVGYAVCDIVFTDEDPTTYLDRLRRIINGLVTESDGKMFWTRKNLEKITRMRSVETLVGVLLAKVYYDDPDPKEDNMSRYGLNERTFDKYYRIVFGDGDDGNED